MEEGLETTKEERLEGDSGTALEVPAETLPSTEFVKVEKNLASLGFFTPSSKRLRNAQEKSFTITTVAEGQRMELKGTIIPSAKYGLPITADQDKWIALCKILTDIIRKEGRVTNPVSFTSAEILRLLHKHRHSGKNYREVEEWLDVLFSTTIFSEGVVYLAGEKRRIKDRYRVFERAVSFGKELSDGKVADKNYVWFSDWQIQNINNNHLLPIDLEAYRELKNHIAKALVPLLQIWLYATRREGVYEKRYDELCQFLNIQQYRYQSLIKRTLGPSLDELKQFGYLADWQIEKTSDRENYKIVFYHGEKFHRDRRTRESRKLNADGAPLTMSERDQHSRSLRENHRIDSALTPRSTPQHFDPALVSEFTRRGITEEKATTILANVKPGQDIVAQLEHYDQLIQHAGFRIVNPPGFYIRMIEKNIAVPEGFETNAKRKAREETEQRERDLRVAEDARELLELEYDRYCDAETERYIQEHPDTFTALKNAKLQEERERPYGLSFEPPETMAARRAKWDIREQTPLLTFEEFVERKKQGTDFFLKPVGPSPAVEPTTEPGVPEDLLEAEERREAEMNKAETLAPGSSTEPATQPSTEAVAEEPMMIELVSDPPPTDLGGTQAEQGSV
jgi:hypothetical protein